MQTEKMTESFDGFRIYAKKDVPEAPRAAVVVVHGLCEHLGRYDYLTEKLNGRGFAVYRFDHRGHGRSDGSRGHVGDFSLLVDDTDFIFGQAKRENPGLPVFVLGHSMGGFTAACYGAKYPGKAAGLILSGALTHDDAGAFASLPAGLDPLTPIPNELTDTICRVPEVRKAYAEDPLCLRSFSAGLGYALKDGVAWLGENAKSFADPALILHGECDRIVSRTDSVKFFSEISSEDKQLKIYGKFYHEILNEYGKDEVIGDIVGWIVRRL